MSQPQPSAPSRPLPASTYRLQVSPDLPLDEVAALVPYLRRLGADWLYLSPLLEAQPGSGHGYDVADPTRVDASRGGPEALERLAEAAHRAGLRIAVDVVPNHLGVADAAATASWWDLLQHGREAAHAAWFDVDWDAGDGRILIPVLGDGPDGDPRGADAGLDRLVVHTAEDGTARLQHWDQAFPLAPGSLAAAEQETGLGAAEVFADARPEDEPTADRARLARAVHERQHYRLVGWRRGDTELNYRRFFTVTTLAGVRVEDPEVFDATHAEIARWVREGLVHGLRVDHPDGLADPGAYLTRLREQVLPEGWLVVEKILEPGEELPAAWPVDGTTGYDALGEIERVFMPAGAAGTAEQDAAARHEWERLITELKAEVASGSLAAETARIVREARAASVLGTHTDDRLAAAVAAVAARLPVYRTYLPVGRARLEAAVAAAVREEPALEDVLTDLAEVLVDPDSPVARRFQQTSGMVMAKGVEDRAFYRWTRWANLNEVGGDPADVALGLGAFHAAQQARQAAWPAAMTTLTTHDTKRSEDVRARIAVLAEDPARWDADRAALAALHPLDAPGLEKLVWESLVGVWPTDGTAPETERLHGFLLKAAREGGERTSWTDGDEAYEERLAALARAVTAPEGPARAVLQAVADRVAGPGLVVQLGVKLVQLAAPGVPDVYQGTEIPFPSLVDPDNRRRVDFAARARLLDRLDDGHVPGLDEPEAAKLAVTAAVLRARRDRPELFTGYRPVDVDGEAAEHAVAFSRGSAEGPGAVAVATRWPDALDRRGGWGDTVLTLPAGHWREAVTGRAVQPDQHGAVRLADLLADLPVALLLPEETTA
ncbi:malto-oligosyltrehalose synthase [Micrococcus sp.]|uniref:malto-oligosyltrehalose synthase n=1 Tax=Micrococcus sp. TaxID=1271 RepID=UPI002A90E2E1|nr:malto-oligosyltrehalose synthase [Micrococcus sp.]MDY6055775.1 malto-oligosyltrehalose synthase [Micrococcus sp.]